MKVNIVQKTKKTSGVIKKIMQSKCLVTIASGVTYRVPMSMLEVANAQFCNIRCITYLWDNISTQGYIMDLTHGILLFVIGIPVSVAVFYVIMYAMKKEMENRIKKEYKKKPSWKSDDCQ